MKKQPTFKPVKGYAVVYSRGSILHDNLERYSFEIRNHTRPSLALVICVTKAGAERWIKKWSSIGQCDVVPVLISPIPQKPRTKTNPNKKR